MCVRARVCVCVCVCVCVYVCVCMPRSIDGVNEVELQFKITASVNISKYEGVRPGY